MPGRTAYVLSAARKRREREWLAASPAQTGSAEEQRLDGRVDFNERGFGSALLCQHCINKTYNQYNYHIYPD